MTHYTTTRALLKQIKHQVDLLDDDLDRFDPRALERPTSQAIDEARAILQRTEALEKLAAAVPAAFNAETQGRNLR